MAMQLKSVMFFAWALLGALCVRIVKRRRGQHPGMEAARSFPAIGTEQLPELLAVEELLGDSGKEDEEAVRYAEESAAKVCKGYCKNDLERYPWTRKCKAWPNCKGCVECEPSHSIRKAWRYEWSEVTCPPKWREVETEAECELAAESMGLKFAKGFGPYCGPYGPGLSGPTLRSGCRSRRGRCLTEQEIASCRSSPRGYACNPFPLPRCTETADVFFEPCDGPSWYWMPKDFEFKACATEAYPHNASNVSLVA